MSSGPNANKGLTEQFHREMDLMVYWRVSEYRTMGNENLEEASIESELDW